jgi:hypothetical protein
MENQQNPVKQSANINLNVDSTPVFFSDFLLWNISPDGVVLNFAQKILGSNQIKIVARIGMSKDFTKKALNDLSKNIALTEAQGQTGKPKG